MEYSVVANNSFPQKSHIRQNAAHGSRDTITGIIIFLDCGPVIRGKRIVSVESGGFKGDAADRNNHPFIREEAVSCRGFWPVRKG